MNDEEIINKKLDEGIDKYFRENRRMQNGAISEIDEVRKQIIDILVEHVNEDGTIDKRKVQRILDEIEVVESEFERKLRDSIDETIDKTTNRAMEVAIGSLGALITAGVITRSGLKKRIKDSMLNREISDGLTLRDRLWRMSGGLLDELRTDIRSGILQGLSVTMIARRMGKTFKDREWMIRRVIMTEGFNTYRKTIGEVAIESGVVKAVRIVDLRGRHPYHERHECYRLAEQDMYGWGKGVYRPQDTFIYYPHPNCTAYFRFILVDTETGGVV